ncbi:MAG: hypothetical protein FJX78_09950 [Armatimonadetes bacterium]|nr:hypothetical protein [Armatimonadota bacterium]
MKHERLCALIDVFENADGFLYAAVIRGNGRALHRLVSRVPGATRTAAFFEGISYALGAARRYGRTLRMAVNDAGVAAMLSKRQEVTSEYVTPFLVARALIHAYRRVEIVEPAAEEKTALGVVIADALASGGVVPQLPLWSTAERHSAA